MNRGGGGFKFQDRDNRNSKYNKYNQQEQPKTTFGSGMTSQQRYHSIVQNVKLDLAGKSNINNAQNQKGCVMHPKISKKCRKCLQLQSTAQIKQQKQKYVLIEKIPEQIKLNNDNPKSHLNQKLISNINNSQKYQNIKGLKSVKQTLHELTPEQIPLQAYRKGTTQDPTYFTVFLYRLMELKPTKPQITIMLRQKNVNIKAVALLYIRMAFDFQHIYAYLSSCFNDDRLINAQFTIGQYAKKLLNEQELDNFGIRLPRIPIKVQKQIKSKLSELQIQAQQLQQKQYKNKEHNINQINNYNSMQGNGQGEVEVSRLPVLENIGERRRRSRDGKDHSSCSSSSSSGSSKSSSSPDSFGSSSSSGSSSQESLQKDKKKQVSKQPPRPKGPPPAQNISLQSLKQRIKAKQDLADMQTKRQSLLSKYQAQSSLKINHQHQAGQINSQSESVQKYQIKK